MPNPYVAAAGLVIDVGSKLLQGRTEEAFDGLNPFSSAGEAQTIVVPSGSQIQHPHKLGKKPNGWQQVCKMGPGDVWEYQEADEKFFYFETSAPDDITLKILVS